MTRIPTVFAAFIFSFVMHAAVFAQVTPSAPGSAAPPTTAAAEVTACSQAQTVVDSLLASASARLESSRQSNDPADMRAAVDALQTTIRDVRAQLAACANVGGTDPHAAHATPGPATKPGTAATPGPTTTEPGVSRPAPSAKPPVTDPHAGHTTPPAKPTPRPAKPPTAKPSASKPAASDPHAGHTTPAATPPRTGEKPSAKPEASTTSPAADPHAGHGAPATTTPSGDGKAVDPVCGLRVDPADAESTKHAGQTYYFCSTKHRDLFVSNPAKFVPNKQ